MFSIRSQIMMWFFCSVFLRFDVPPSELFGITGFAAGCVHLGQGTILVPTKKDRTSSQQNTLA